MRPLLSLVASLLCLGPAAVSAQQLISGENFVPGQVIVKLRDAGTLQALSQGAGTGYEAQVFARLQAKHRLVDDEPVAGRLDARGCRVLKTDRDVMALCAQLNRDPDIEYAQPNYIYHICREPNDPDFPDQYAHQLIQMADAWNISTGSRNTVVAVLGTGVDVNHPDLKSNIWVNKGEVPGNGKDDDNNGYVDDIYGWNFEGSNNDVTPEPSEYDDTVNHETNVAGVIAAVGNNGVGVTGVNWQCSVMVLRLSLSFTSAEVAGGLNYAAANGARVVNMSFGGDSFGPEGDVIVKNAIDNAFAKGVLLVASAGNSDTSRPHYPAAYYNVLAVASTNGEDSKTGHSTFGPWVDIAAPGTDIVTTDLGGKYIATAGTSFSSPYVAAVATLLFSHRPRLSHIEARAILENTTDPLDYGELDPNLVYLGTGRVNAYQTLLGADVDYPLGEIVAPGARQTYPADGNALGLRLFLRGDSYLLDYRPYGRPDWTLITQEAAPKGPSGIAAVALANPGVGTYELRLRVRRGEYTHTDRKVFAVERAVSKPHWPKPDNAADSFEIFWGSPLCLDLNGDGRNEVIQASIDLLDFFTGGGKINAWDPDGKPLANWPTKTGEALPTSVAVGDIDGDGDYEVVAACELDGEVYAYHVESGKLVTGSWPAAIGGWYGWIPASPVLADLDGDGDSEILIALDMESADTDGLIVLQHDGTTLWQRRYTSAGPISAGDLDKDGRVEIALSGYGPGLSRLYTFILNHQGQQIARVLGGSALGTVIADLDADGKSEVVFCTDKEVMAIRANGSTLWKTAVADPLDTGGGLCVGDVNGDGLSEVYVEIMIEWGESLFTRVYAFDHQGRPLIAAGYPKTIMGYPSRSVPLIADVDGDGQKELLVGPSGEPLMAWEADGSVTPGFPLLTLAPDVECNPALADFDRDGTLEIMVPTDDYLFQVVDLAVPYRADKVDWGMIHHDAQNSGWTAPVPQIDVAVIPSQVKTGQRVEIHLAAVNPGNLPVRWLVPTLPPGAHYDPNTLTISWEPTAAQAFQSHTLAFTLTDGVRQDSRSVSITVTSDAFYVANMDTDPNWTYDTGWSWGVPARRAGIRRDDPDSGHTGENVLGYAVKGNYTNNIAETRYVTTPPIDCRGRQNIRLSFWRWLSIESPADYACIQVSREGATWTDLWVAGSPAVLDEAWTYVEYAVPPEIGDNQPTVYFRWGLGPTNKSVTYGGWNIDDVQLTGAAIAK